MNNIVVYFIIAGCCSFGIGRYLDEIKDFIKSIEKKEKKK